VKIAFDNVAFEDGERRIVPLDLEHSSIVQAGWNFFGKDQLVIYRVAVFVSSSKTFVKKQPHAKYVFDGN